MRATLWLAATLCFAASSGFAQDAPSFPYDRFHPATLAEVSADVEAHDGAPPGHTSIVFSDMPKVRVNAVYLGERRPLSPAERELIDKFGRMLRLDMATFAEPYRESFAFEDQGRRYWMPVQAEVADFFPKELKRGQSVTLYALVIGGFSDQGRRPEPVLLVEEFDVAPR